MRLFPALALCLALPGLAAAEALRIDGPTGPLEGEALAVPGARHALVIVPGSGLVDRDGNSGDGRLATDAYKLLAEGLAEAGIASIRIDKRGFFGSAGAAADPNAATVAGYAEDARAWVGRAAALAPCVWIAGHSEGGLVALVAAQTPPKTLCGLILLAAPGRPVGRILEEQLAANPYNTALIPEIRAIIADLEAGRTRDPGTIAAPLRPLFGAGPQRFMIDLFAWDPAAPAAEAALPMLVVQGDADLQISAADAALLTGAAPGAESAPLAGMTHMLKPDRPGAPWASYADPAIPLHSGLVPAIRGFLDRHPPRN